RMMRRENRPRIDGFSSKLFGEECAKSQCNSKRRVGLRFRKVLFVYCLLAESRQKAPKVEAAAYRRSGNRLPNQSSRSRIDIGKDKWLTHFIAGEAFQTSYNVIISQK